MQVPFWSFKLLQLTLPRVSRGTLLYASQVLGDGSALTTALATEMRIDNHARDFKGARRVEVDVRLVEQFGEFGTKHEAVSRQQDPRISGERGRRRAGHIRQRREVSG